MTFPRLSIKMRLVVVLIGLLTLVQLAYILSVSAFLTTTQDQRDKDLIKSAALQINSTAMPLDEPASVSVGKPEDSPHGPVAPETRQWLLERGLRAWITDVKNKVVVAFGSDPSESPPLPLPPMETPVLVHPAVGAARLVWVNEFWPTDTFSGQNVVIALDPQETHTEARFTVAILWYVLPLSLVLIGVVGFIVTRQALRPVAIINDTTEKITRGEIDSRIAVGRERDELSRLAVNINSMLDRLQESLYRERQFSDDVAHELRTPLGALKAGLSLARSRPREASRLAEMMADMESDVDRMSDLVLRMLKLGRGYWAVAGSLSSVARVFDRCLEKHQAFARASGVEIVVDSADLLVWVEEEALQQVLDNLVENAVRHTEALGRVNLSVAPSPREGMVRVQVEDTGCGIPEHHLPHVFERFYRADDSRSRRTGGFGLGLAIVRSIIEAFGGTVSIESQVGVGTRAIIDLPSI